MPLEGSSSAVGMGSWFPTFSHERECTDGARDSGVWCGAGSLILQRLDGIHLSSAGGGNSSEYYPDNGCGGECDGHRPIRDGQRIVGEDADGKGDSEADDTADESA